MFFNPPFLTHSGKLDAKLSKYFAQMQPTSVRIEHRTCTLNAIASHMFDHMHRCLELFYEFVSDTSNVHDIFLSLSLFLSLRSIQRSQVSVFNQIFHTQASNVRQTARTLDQDETIDTMICTFSVDIVISMSTKKEKGSANYSYGGRIRVCYFACNS